MTDNPATLENIAIAMLVLISKLHDIHLPENYGLSLTPKM